MSFCCTPQRPRRQPSQFIITLTWLDFHFQYFHFSFSFLNSCSSRNSSCLTAAFRPPTSIDCLRVRREGENNYLFEPSAMTEMATDNPPAGVKQLGHVGSNDMRWRGVKEPAARKAAKRLFTPLIQDSFTFYSVMINGGG